MIFSLVRPPAFVIPRDGGDLPYRPLPKAAYYLITFFIVFLFFVSRYLGGPASFRGPSRFGDQITMESWVGEWRSKVFVVEHRIHNNGNIVVEGREVRVWGLRDPNDPEGLKAGVIPPEIIARFQD